ncbi:MAG: hypothetical protein AAB477_02610 [Patescibacteria group bacterium]
MSKSRKRNLFFDLDGMKFNTLPAHVAYVNHRYGINTLPEEYIGKNDSFDSVIKRHATDVTLTWEGIYKDLGENFHSSVEWHKDVKPMEDMCEVVPLLSKKYNLYTVTARQKNGQHVVQYLLDKYIPNCIRDIHCSWDYIPGVGFVEVQKKDFIQKTEGENVAFFDDSLKEVKRAQNVITSHLFDPNSSYKDINGMNRIESWKRIGELYL